MISELTCNLVRFRCTATLTSYEPPYGGLVFLWFSIHLWRGRTRGRGVGIAHRSLWRDVETKFRGDEINTGVGGGGLHRACRCGAFATGGAVWRGTFFRFEWWCRMVRMRQCLTAKYFGRENYSGRGAIHGWIRGVFPPSWRFTSYYMTA